jgi:hypothetical protein
MHLVYIDIAQLIAHAGGDPWAINNSLQVGRPAQISDLAEAFHAAGRCTTESSNAFDEARRRFEASWNHENGDNPINDSAEVQRVVKSLGAQSLQLPKIGVELERIAAALAGVQRSGAVLISNLETQLEVIDSQLGVALEQENSRHLTAAEKDIVEQHITALEDQAIADTKAALGQLRSVRSEYSDCLQSSRFSRWMPLVPARTPEPKPIEDRTKSMPSQRFSADRQAPQLIGKRLERSIHTATNPKTAGGRPT